MQAERSVFPPLNCPPRFGDNRCVLSDGELTALLAEDAPYGDLTTQALGIAGCGGRLVFSARQTMRVCGVEEAVRLFLLAGAEAELVHGTGLDAPAGQVLLRAEGPAGALHLAWKTAQILVEWASGLATGAAELVRVAAPVPVACTRKNPPGTKALAAKAVAAGGAVMHRLGLSETLLVFPEHRLFLSGEPRECIARLQQRQPEKKVVVEVKNQEEALLWARAGADVLQLEKFFPEQIAACRQALAAEGLTPRLAAAGGIHAGNGAAYVAAGAQVLVSSAPYMAPPRDVQVDFSVR